MKDVCSDNNGKEAFAYLAITLLLLSSFFIAYMVAYRRASDEMEERSNAIERVNDEMDEIGTEIRMLLDHIHDRELISVLDQDVNENGSRSDPLLEMRLNSVLFHEIDHLIGQSEISSRGIDIEIENITIDVIPIPIYHEIPYPGNGDDGPNGSGRWDSGLFPGSMGVNTSITVALRCIDTGNQIEVLKRVESNIIRRSRSDIVRSRLALLEDALSGYELLELNQNILTTLANSKAYLGYGRRTVPSGMAEDLLSHEELAACFDLSVSLLARQYLGSYDIDHLTAVEDRLRSERSSNGCSPSIKDMIENDPGPVDAGMLVNLVEGLFSETCPPTAEEMLRPLLMSLVERLIIGTVDYIGIEPDTLEAFGSVHGFYRKIDEGFEKFVETITGREMLSEAERAAIDMMGKLYGLHPGLEGYEGMILIPGIEGFEYNGSKITGFPYMDPQPVNSSLLVDLLNGSVVSRYFLEISLDPSPKEPDLLEVQLKDNDIAVDEMVSILGLDSRTIEGEVILKEHCDSAIRSSIDELLSELSSGTGDIWNETWNGWERDDLPSLNTSVDPTGYLLNATLPEIGTVLDLLFEMIYEKLELVNFNSLRSSLFSSFSSSFSDMVHSRYNDIIDLDRQLEHSRSTYLKELHLNLEMKILNISYMGDQEDHYRVAEDASGNRISYEEFLEDPSILFDHVFNGSAWSSISPAMENNIDISTTNCIERVRKREWAEFNDTWGPGYMRSALLGHLTRSNGRGMIENSTDGWLKDLKDRTNRTVNRLITGLENDLSNNRDMTSSRYFLRDLNSSDSIRYRIPGFHGRYEDLNLSIGISTQGITEPSLTVLGGCYNPDPASNGSRYRGDLSVHITRTVHIETNLEGGYAGVLKMEISSNSTFTVYSIWPLEDVEYETGETLLDIATDKAKEATKEIFSLMMNCSSGILPDSLGSLKEVPPLVMNIIENGDLDLADIMKVITNISLDLSTSLREMVKELIKDLVERGLSEVLSRLLDIIGLDTLLQEVRIGPLLLSISVEREALMGELGTLILMEFEIDDIGLHGSMRLTRGENATMRFNGTVFVSLNTLSLRIEIDPFMEDRAHMISLDGSRVMNNGDLTRISLSIPALKEYRSTEVSLSGSLGVEPRVPIPPLGIQAVIDGGFRLNYLLPDELPPVMNEIFFENGSITGIEIFDPRSLPFSGSTLECRDEMGTHIRSWKIEGPPERYSFFDIGDGNIMFDSKDPIPSYSIHLILRSPSGLIMDDVLIEEREDGSFSRENDGFGVWRWVEGTPGSQNSNSKHLDIRSVIISLAISSLKEAWEIAYGEYGLSFQTVTCFLENTVDLFIRRFTAMVAEIVVDVRLFLQVEIEDATGTGGGGMELSLRAEGEAVAVFLEWIYENIKVLISNMKDPNKSGDLIGFPVYILEECWITVLFYSEVETPVQIKKVAVDAVEIPDDLLIGYTGSINLAFPAGLLGIDAGGWSLEFGLMIMEAPASIVSLFYDIGSFSSKTDLWIVQARVWEEQIQHNS